MFYQTSTTISLIASGMMFLTKNTLCSTNQQTNSQNDPALQNSSHLYGPNKDERFADALKNLTLSELERLESKLNAKIEEFNKLKDPAPIIKTIRYNSKLVAKTYLALAKDVWELKNYFSEGKYKKFYDHLNLSYSKFIYKYSTGATLDCTNGIFFKENIKDLNEIIEKSEEIFTSGVGDKEEEDKIINIIKKVNESMGNSLKITKFKPNPKIAQVRKMCYGNSNIFITNTTKADPTKTNTLKAVPTNTNTTNANPTNTNTTKVNPTNTNTTKVNSKKTNTTKTKPKKTNITQNKSAENMPAENKPKGKKGILMKVLFWVGIIIWVFLVVILLIAIF